MPWHIEQRDNEYCVIKDDDDTSAGCHPTREAAEAQLAALYASEGGKAEFKRYTYNGVTCQATGRHSSSRDDKKYERTVRYDGSERTVHYGDPNMEMQRDNEDARANFLARHNCDQKTDPFAPGFWACYDWQNTNEKAARFHALAVAHALYTGDEPPAPPEPPAAKSAGIAMVGDAPPDPVAGMQMTDGEREIFNATYKRVFDATEDEVKALLAAYGAIRRKRYNLAVKSRTSNGGVLVEGWAIMFGDPVKRDLEDTYFNAETDYMLDYYKGAPLWLEHGQDRGARSHPCGYRVSYKVYPEHGIWLTHEMTPEQPAFQFAEFQSTVNDVERGEYTYSTDSLSHHVANGYKDEDGHLSVWALAGCSLVRNPAEPGLGMAIIRQADAMRE